MNPLLAAGNTPYLEKKNLKFSLHSFNKFGSY